MSFTSGGEILIQEEDSGDTHLVSGEDLRHIQQWPRERDGREERLLNFQGARTAYAVWEEEEDSWYIALRDSHNTADLELRPPAGSRWSSEWLSVCERPSSSSRQLAVCDMHSMTLSLFTAEGKRHHTIVNRFCWSEFYRIRILFLILIWLYQLLFLFLSHFISEQWYLERAIMLYSCSHFIVSIKEKLTEKHRGHSVKWAEIYCECFAVSDLKMSIILRVFLSNQMFRFCAEDSISKSSHWRVLRNVYIKSCWTDLSTVCCWYDERRKPLTRYVWRTEIECKQYCSRSACG